MKLTLGRNGTNGKTCGGSGFKSIKGFWCQDRGPSFPSPSLSNPSLHDHLPTGADQAIGQLNQNKTLLWSQEVLRQHGLGFGQHAWLSSPHLGKSERQLEIVMAVAFATSLAKPKGCLRVIVEWLLDH